jgi:hypothetical protein
VLGEILSEIGQNGNIQQIKEKFKSTCNRAMLGVLWSFSRDDLLACLSLPLTSFQNVIAFSPLQCERLSKEESWIGLCFNKSGALG